jgi:beta-lactamase regulating signal transducer with metallopeptidase domain
MLSAYGRGVIELPLLQTSIPQQAAATTVEVEMAPQTGNGESHDDTHRWMVTVELLWGAGVLVASIRFAGGCLAVRRLKRSIQPCASIPAEDVLAASVSLPRLRQLRIYTSPEAQSPAALGPFGTAIVLPDGMAESLSASQLRQILLHEGAHIAFRHSAGSIVARLAAAVFWPNPLVHLVCRELAKAREEICDNVALQEGGAACYARTLLTVAQGLSAAPSHTSALALLGPESSLEERIAGLLDPRRDRMIHANRWKLWAITAATAGVMTVTAAVRVVAADDPALPAPGVASRGAVHRVASEPPTSHLLHTVRRHASHHRHARHKVTYVGGASYVLTTDEHGDHRKVVHFRVNEGKPYPLIHTRIHSAGADVVFKPLKPGQGYVTLDTVDGAAHIHFKPLKRDQQYVNLRAIQSDHGSADVLLEPVKPGQGSGKLRIIRRGSNHSADILVTPLKPDRGYADPKSPQQDKGKSDVRVKPSSSDSYRIDLKTQLKDAGPAQLQVKPASSDSYRIELKTADKVDVLKRLKPDSLQNGQHK